MTSRKRRRTYWLGTTFDYAGLVVGLNNFVIASNIKLHDTSQEPTVIRLVGRLHFEFERDSGGFKESMRSSAWFGIACVHEDLPQQSPRVEIEDEQWMWTGYCATQSTFTEYSGIQFDANTVIGGSTQSRGTQHIGGPGEFVDLDARSMRKAPQPCELALCVDVREHLPEVGATHKLSGYIRALIKE